MYAFDDKAKEAEQAVDLKAAAAETLKALETVPKKEEAKASDSTEANLSSAYLAHSDKLLLWQGSSLKLVARDTTAGAFLCSQAAMRNQVAALDDQVTLACSSDDLQFVLATLDFDHVTDKSLTKRFLSQIADGTVQVQFLDAYLAVKALLRAASLQFKALEDKARPLEAQLLTYNEE